MNAFGTAIGGRSTAGAGGWDRSQACRVGRIVPNSTIYSPVGEDHAGLQACARRPTCRLVSLKVPEASTAT